MEECAVAVVGSGVAGCAIALALAKRGVRDVWVIGASPSNGIRVGESIPPDSRLLLQTLGIWDEFSRQGHEPCLGNCSSWGSTELGYSDFVLNPYGNGWHLDRERFEELLTEAVDGSGLRRMPRTRVVGCSREGGGFRLRCLGEDQRERDIRAMNVVDASGCAGAVARPLGARRLFLDHLVLLYGCFETPAGWAGQRKFTVLEAAPEGWWYLAAIPGHRAAVAFATDPELLRTRGFHMPERWLAELLKTRLIAPRLDGCALVSEELAVRPAPSFVLDRVAGEGWLTIGDAAAAYDPLSAQGIYKALSDGIEAAKAVAEGWLSAGGRWSEYDSTVKEQFETYRMNRNHFYQLERRWPESDFWKRRQERTTVAPGGSDARLAE